MLQSLLAAFTGAETAVIICLAALCVTVIVLCIIMLVVTNKARRAKKVKSRPAPIIIYRTKRVAVPKQEPVIVYVKEEREEEAAVADAEPAAEEAPEELPAEEIPEEPAPYEEPAPVAPVAPAAPDDSENAMRYNRSFRARLIQSDDEVKEWYSAIKNTVMAYDRVSSRISWKYESFNYRRNAVAKLFIKGKTLYLYLPLKAADYADTKYKLEDVSKISQFADTPALYKLKSERRVKYAQELLTGICEKLGSKLTDREPVDYYEPYNSDVALIKKGLVKRVIEDAKTSFIGASGYSKEQDEVTDFDSKK